MFTVYPGLISDLLVTLISNMCLSTFQALFCICACDVLSEVEVFTFSCVESHLQRGGRNVF